MIRCVLLGLVAGLMLAACDAQAPAGAGASASGSEQNAISAPQSAGSQTAREEAHQSAQKRNGGQEPAKLDLLSELTNKAREELGATKEYGKPRIAMRGAKPEIIIRSDKITFEGHEIRIGDTLERWMTILPPGARCIDEGPSEPMVCIWDSLAIHVGTNRESRRLVKYINVYPNVEPQDPSVGLVTRSPDGTPRSPPQDFRPKHPFPGYLELDGFGIDAKTKFWEIRASADPKRNLRCGTRDCSHPHGGFSDSANLYLRLNRADEFGTLYELSISGDEQAAPPAPTTPK